VVPVRGVLGRTTRQVGAGDLLLHRSILDRESSTCCRKRRPRHELHPDKALLPASQLETHPRAERIVAVFSNTRVRWNRCNRQAACPPATSTAGLNEGGALCGGWPAGCGLKPLTDFIHAEDIARVCVNLTLQPTNPPEPGQGPLGRLGLGQPAVQRGTDTVVGPLPLARDVPPPVWPAAHGWLIEALIKGLADRGGTLGSAQPSASATSCMKPNQPTRSASGLVSLAPSLERAF